ncbi:hypothetical protein AURANDRAFT_63937 [Aureococcus anophagefferens]|uniref:Uncharacterized protein n=1 Tax=Aureococcus anophagefferens TaxID=44056 RepID=F0Y8B4_AURAN|nr:hypothetical protein AURANDRAFT_63937 [Aureococcus anophagefferens]EGB08742.1 hypothetical protein AURANDRAFT_63937 [Aureococcus anophagefferens]|eukprot:XP_009036727.1 hypothetical protein AURANDRAFT_63937 [Aureococcus anophagefferens]
MALPVVAKRDVAASWLAELDCIGGTLKKLGGSGASEAQKGTAKRRSVFSRAPQWKSRLFWVEIAAPAAGENYVLQYGDAKRKPKGAFALEGATVDAVADTDGDFRLHARVGRAWVTVTLRAPTGRERGVWMRTLAHVADVATRRGAAEGSTRAAERESAATPPRARAPSDRSPSPRPSASPRRSSFSESVRKSLVGLNKEEEAAKLFRESLEEVFRAIQTDGQLACAELAAVHFDKALLERLDGDGDGFLSVDEFVHFFGDAVEGERDEKKTAKLLREGIELVGRVLAWRQKQKDRLHAAALRAHNAALAKHAAELAAAKKESRAAKRESRALKARLSAAPGEVLEADDDEPSASESDEAAPPPTRAAPPLREEPPPLREAAPVARASAVAQRRSVFARIEEDSSDEAEPPPPADTDSYSDEAEPPPVLARPAAAPGKPVAARGVTRSPGKHKRTRAHFAPSASEANVLVAPIEAPRPPPPAAEAVEEEAAAVDDDGGEAYDERGEAYDEEEAATAPPLAAAPPLEDDAAEEAPEPAAAARARAAPTRARASTAAAPPAAAPPPWELAEPRRARAATAAAPESPALARASQLLSRSRLGILAPGPPPAAVAAGCPRCASLRTHVVTAAAPADAPALLCLDCGNRWVAGESRRPRTSAPRVPAPATPKTAERRRRERKLATIQDDVEDAAWARDPLSYAPRAPDASTFYGAPPAARKRASTKPPARASTKPPKRAAPAVRAPPGAAAHAARERQRADGAYGLRARARYVADLELEARDVIDRLRAAVAAEDAATLPDLLALVRRLHRRATANREEAVRRPGVAARTRWICAGVEQQCALEERRLAAALPAPAVAAAGDEENVPAAHAPKTPRLGCGGRDAPWSLL